ncbi:MAG TPA: hypothetical protein PLH57_09230, partial [Oligoflexia bacterium]|nr:hypothetical protein [Oligoflexia bacterium]
MKALAALAVHLKLFAKYLLFSVVVIGVFQFPEILAKFWSEKIPFQTIKLNPREIKTAPLALEAGHYFVSYGIVRGACDALLNDKVADSNMSEGNGIRSKIMLGHEFIVIKDTPVTLALRCDYQAGFTTSLANEPL